jgi:predicted permease
MLNDFRYALRGLRRAPTFTAAAGVTLALGIAVNTIVFTVIHSLAFRPLPVRAAQDVVRIYPVDAAGRRHNLFSHADYAELNGPAPGFEGLAAYIPAAVTAADGESPREALAYVVSASYFQLLGIGLSLGRSFSAQEEADPGAGRVTVISHSLWTRRFDGRADVLGRTVAINGQAFAIIGIGPSRFMGTEPLEPDFWVPLSAHDVIEPGAGNLRGSAAGTLLIVGRLAEGISKEAAERSLSLAASRLPRGAPRPGRPVAVAVVAGTFFTATPELRPVIRLALGVVALVLVIACANIANLVLTRAAGRRRETTIRLALGASRARLARHLLAESLAIAAVGAMAGLLLSAWVLRLLYPLGVSLLPFRWASVVLDLTPDVRVFGYTLVLALGAGLVIGLTPLVQASSSAIAAGLRDHNTVFGRQIRSSRIRDTLVVLQMALCLMLLAGAALAGRALRRSEALDLGFTAGGVVHASAGVERLAYTRAAAAELYRRLAERAGQLPGVEDLAFTTHVPLTGGVQRTVAGVEGLDTSATACTYTAVSPGYFRTLRIPIVAGRDFTDREAAAGAPAAIISEALARRFWPGSSGLGRQVTSPRSAAPLTIVGVVRDATDVSLWREKEIALYLPASFSTSRNLRLLVRTSGDPLAVAADLRREAAAYDRNLGFDAAPLTDVLKLWILPSRVAAISAVVLGAIALAMASIGIYGVVAYAASQRGREIGVRVALGASRGDIRRLVLADGVRLVSIGLVIGLAGAGVLARVIAAFLPAARAVDPVAFAAAAVVLVSVAMAACFLPARTAASVDPLVALRNE